MYSSLSSKTLKFSLLLLWSLFSLNSIAGPVTDYGQLQVQGNKIVSGKTGEPVQLKGYSTHGLQWFPYAIGNGGTIENMVKDFDVQVVRLAMYVHEKSGANGDIIAGYLGENSTIYEDQVRPLILDAIANDIYVIVDWHIHWNPPSDENKHWTPSPFTNEAKTFFNMVAAEFGTHPNIIYEVMNEPGHQITWQQVKDHSIPVYDEIRAIDSDNLILVPTPDWSKDILSAANNPIKNEETVSDATNIAYTMHFYAQSHNFRNNAEEALNKGIALFVSEWGMSDFSGNGAVDLTENGSSDQWVDWMQEHGISWLAWNFANKDESSSALKAYENNNLGNEWLWSQNTLQNGVAMQSGPWTDEVITDSGKWIRSRIQEGQVCKIDCDCTTDCPSVIQAEDYAQMNGIQTEATSDIGGGENVGYIDPGDWMTYSVNLPSSGSYTVNYRVASAIGGSFQFEQAGGEIVYGTINVDNTGGWQNWQTISHTVNLTAGQQEVALASLSGAWNINWFEIVSNDLDLDSDNDGVADSLDACPDTPAGTVVKANGCEDVPCVQVVTTAYNPITGEVRDFSTPCDVPSNWVVGTPPDLDNDGVNDIIDQCLNTAVGVEVNALGCALPKDSDNDGVIDDIDDIDECPGTLAGTNVGANGCEIIADACEGINTYPNWVANDWPGTPNNHNNPGDWMQVDGNAYSANWYTTTLPGSDASWKFEKSCN